MTELVLSIIVPVLIVVMLAAAVLKIIARRQ
jgi:hypothetical protein